MSTPNITQHQAGRIVMIVLAFAFAAALGLILFTPMPAHSQVQSIVLNWTAPGDDGAIGTATSYDLRWSASKPDTTNAAAMAAWWAGATKVAPLPSPATAGSGEAVTVTPSTPFLTGTTYYFVIRATDDAGNVGGYSNVASKFSPDITPPRAIIDLR